MCDSLTTDARHGRLFLVIVVRGIQLKELGYDMHEKHENGRNFDCNDGNEEIYDNQLFGGSLVEPFKAFQFLL
jgi:hypothetical protein